MEIIVCVKQILDPYGMVYYDHQAFEVKKEGVASVINPSDELALEYALKLKDSTGGKVIVICLGSSNAEESLRYCLSVGADRAIVISTQDIGALEAYTTGRLLAKAISHLHYDLILCGLQAADDNTGLVWAVIAEELGLAAVGGVREVLTAGGERRLVVHRGEEGGERSILELDLPAVLAIESGLKLRYPALRSRLAAQKIAIEKLSLDSLQVSPDEAKSWSNVKLARFSLPKPKRRGLLIPDESLSAFERIQLLMTGGITTKGASKLSGEPNEVAVKLAEILKENDLVKTIKK